jgi:ABC-2 type transport system ATP-binding protein
VEGTLPQIQAKLGGAASTVTVRARPVEAALACLRSLPDLGAVRVGGDRIEIDVDPGRAAEINRALVLADVAVDGLATARRSLEDAFLGLTEMPTDDDAERPSPMTLVEV